MASKYSEPELLVAEWIGPYRLDEAPDKCDISELAEAVYVVFGRHKRLSYWPLWFETRWVRRIFETRSFTESTRATRWPLQYIGIGNDPCDRANAKSHEHLKHLDPKRSYVWYAKPVVQVAPDRRTAVGWPTSVYALEKCLIFLIKPRRNQTERDQSSAPLITAWCRIPGSAGIKSKYRAMAARLPASIRFDPSKEAVIEFHGGIPERHVRLRLNNGKIVA